MIEKLSHWIQIVSGIVLMVGVVLVVVQVRQTERHTVAQMTGNLMLERAALAATLAGETPMRSLAVLCDPDATLTTEDALILHALFLSRFYEGLYPGAAVYAGEFDDSDGQALKEFVNSMGLPLSFAQGRAWLESFPMQDRTLDAIRASPYYGLDCTRSGPDSGPIRALMDADLAAKARMRAEESATPSTSTTTD